MSNKHLTPNTSGPFGQSTLGKIGNVGGRTFATGLGGMLGGPLGATGTNLLWNRIWGGNKTPSPAFTFPGAPQANPYAIPSGPLQLPGYRPPTAVPASANPFVGNISSLPTPNFFTSGVIPPPPNVMNMPISSIQSPMANINLNPTGPSSPVVPPPPSPNANYNFAGDPFYNNLAMPGSPFASPAQESYAQYIQGIPWAVGSTAADNPFAASFGGFGGQGGAPWELYAGLTGGWQMPIADQKAEDMG